MPFFSSQKSLNFSCLMFLCVQTKFVIQSILARFFFACTKLVLKFHPPVVTNKAKQTVIFLCFFLPRILILDYFKHITAVYYNDLYYRKSVLHLLKRMFAVKIFGKFWDTLYTACDILVVTVSMNNGYN